MYRQRQPDTQSKQKQSKAINNRIIIGIGYMRVGLCTVDDFYAHNENWTTSALGGGRVQGVLSSKNPDFFFKMLLLNHTHLIEVWNVFAFPPRRPRPFDVCFSLADLYNKIR